jgi:hypothetical protein
MTALIITDESEAVRRAAKTISDALEGIKVKICTAQTFQGTDILPADLFFIGCEKPKPEAFAYLEDMLSHINFALKKCGVFSTKQNTLKYLAKIIKDCDAKTGEPLLIAGETKKADIKKWLKGILK